MNKLASGFFAALISLAFFVSDAHASDQCRDILVSGPLQNVSWKEKSYYQNLLYAHFAALTYEQSKSDTAFSGSIPIGEEVMGSLDYSRGQFDERKKEIERTLFRSTTNSRELNVAMSTGDPEIVGAWRSCMVRNHVGLTIRLEASTPRVAKVIVAFDLVGTQNVGALRSDVTFLDADGNSGDDVAIILTGRECLTKGATFFAGSPPCEARIRIKDSVTPIYAEARWSASNTLGGTADDGLPARLVPGTPERKPYEFLRDCGRANLPANLGEASAAGPIAAYRTRCIDRLFTTSKRTDTPSELWVVRISPEDVDKGWRFDAESAEVKAVAPYGDNGNYILDETHRMSA